MTRSLAELDVLVLAGGLGTRLSGTLGNTPKVLAPVGDRVFLDYLLEFLVSQGVRKVVLSLGHLAEKVLSHIAGLRWPFSIESVVEPEPLGTAGAIAFAQPALSSDPVLVLNGDTWLEIDLSAMLSAHLKAPVPLATIACVKVDDARRYGSVELAVDGSILRFVEKEKAAAIVGLVNGGAYLLSARLLDTLASYGKSSLERDVLPKLPKGSMRGHVVAPTNFIDIGTPESYARAGTLFEQGPRRCG